jgi:C1A family cysteine protease
MPTTNPHLRRILNCEPSRATENDWLTRHATAANILAAGSIPRSKDLRNTGSCVGWASADSVIRWHMVKAARLAQDELLSPRFLWMASKETDIYDSYPSTFIESDGTSLKGALDIARKFGTVTDATLPFASGALYQAEAATFYAVASQRKISSYFNLGTDLAKWRAWIAQNGPLLTRLGVDATWDNAKATNGKLSVYKPATVRGGHAVALVGYTSSTFIVRNSWGTANWGDAGFGYASNAYAKAAFTEAYGVTL